MPSAALLYVVSQLCLESVRQALRPIDMCSSMSNALYDRAHAQNYTCSGCEFVSMQAGHCDLPFQVLGALCWQMLHLTDCCPSAACIHLQMFWGCR